MADNGNGGVPRSWGTVLKVIDSARREVREWSTAEIDRIEYERDCELGRLDRAAALLGEQDVRPKAEGRPEAPSTGKPPAAAARKRRRKPATTTKAAVRKRVEAVARLLGEQQQPLPLKQIAQTLRLSVPTVRTALKTLIDEGRAETVGESSHTKYAPKGAGPGSGAGGMRGETLAGRILATVEDRSRVSLDELAQATGESREVVQRVCGTLIREEEIRMGSHNGRPVYLSSGVS